MLTKSQSSAIIRVNELDFYYGSFHALKKVSIEIPEKNVTALIGPSGCGKSTFLRCLNRMNDEIDGARMVGEIRFSDEQINRRDVDVVSLRRQIGMVFQRPNPFPQSVYDNVAYGPRIHGIKDKAKLDEIVQRSLEKAYLWEEVKEKLKQPGTSLSGGQQQRLCIARVLAVQPEVILMDEPCSALDPIATFRIEELIEELKSEYTIVIVTHNMQQASRVSDFTGFFLSGELVEFGETDQVFTAPQRQETEDYIRGRFG